MSFIAGPYSLTYGAADLGIVEDAIRQELTATVDVVRGDNLGDSVQDGVYRGGNMFLDMVLQEYNAAAAPDAFWPWNAVEGVVGAIGRLMSGVAAALVLTKIAGSTATPSTRTYGKVVLAENYPVSMLLGSRLKNVPLRLRCLPYKPASDTVWFVDS